MNTLLDNCYWYIENCNYESWDKFRNKEVYLLAVDYIYGPDNLTERQKARLMSFFNMPVFNYNTF